MTKRNPEVDKYLTNVSGESRDTLQQLRDDIFDIIPKSEEVIYYHMPTFKYKGKPFLVYAEFKDHLSLVTMRHDLITNLKHDLADYVVVGTTIHFSAEKPLSKKLLEKIVRERLAPPS